MFKLYMYELSADDGKTWTTQWLTANEAEEHEKNGYIVNQLSWCYKEI